MHMVLTMLLLHLHLHAIAAPAAAAADVWIVIPSPHATATLLTTKPTGGRIRIIFAHSPSTALVHTAPCSRTLGENTIEMISWASGVRDEWLYIILQ
jgi:hypothetical protein